MQRLAARFASALAVRLVKRWQGLYKALNIARLESSEMDQDRLRDLTLDMLNIRSGEFLAIASILSLHVLLAEDDRVDAQFGLNKNNNSVKDCKQMGEFLAMVHSISPKVVLLVEQESDHNLTRLVDRLVEGLHYYSAIFDSIDSIFGGSSCEERIGIEETFGKEIESIMACEGLEREERHERYAKWTVRFARAGFKPVCLWYDSLEEAKRLMVAYGPEGYLVVNQRAGLMICWHGRPIYSVSAWTCFN
ncbi:hypothetical protein Acr_00g0012370 [Actinidia rufa]|uniref:GRAS family transcription factor n=1 Tax=Actinidia rufa TaxID=165716 RepID=A0A7J0DAB0_9ERIC|nr:hypothetical protein Acr_00g0012370 [Actinidia rufa]